MATTAKINITLDRSKMLNFSASMYGPEFLERILEAVQKIAPEAYQVQANFGSDIATVDIATTEDVEGYPDIGEIYSIIRQTYEDWNQEVQKIDKEKLEGLPFDKGQKLVKSEGHQGDTAPATRYLVEDIHYDNDGFVVYEIETLGQDGKPVAGSLESVSLEHVEEIFTTAS